MTNLLIDQGPSLCSGPLELNSHCAGPALSPGKHVQNQRETLSWTMRHLSYSYSTFCLPFGAFHARYNGIGCLFRGLEPPIYLSFDDMGKRLLVRGHMDQAVPRGQRTSRADHLSMKGQWCL